MWAHYKIILRFPWKGEAVDRTKLDGYGRMDKSIDQAWKLWAVLVNYHSIKFDHNHSKKIDEVTK